MNSGENVTFHQQPLRSCLLSHWMHIIPSSCNNHEVGDNLTDFSLNTSEMVNKCKVTGNVATRCASNWVDNWAPNNLERRYRRWHYFTMHAVLLLPLPSLSSHFQAPPLPLHLLKFEEERNLATYKVNARISSANVFNLKIAGFQERKETCVRIFLIWCNFFDDQTAKENDQTSYRFTDPKTVLMMIASLIKKFKA